MHEPADIETVSWWPLPADLAGATPAAHRAGDAARRAASTDDAVLIAAEHGFNAERIAGAIHAASSRAARPFVAVDCSESPPAVAQRLFGAERAPRAGHERATAGSALSAAGDGTLFLADVGEMPAAVQLRLSRLLRDGEFRLGRSMTPVRFRLMASSAPGLEADVHDRRFRPELYRRLQRLRIDVLPLRDRPDDLPSLIDHVMDEICEGRTPCTLAPAARTALAALRWVGNLEELRAVLGRLVERSESGVIRQEDVLADLQVPQGRARRSQPTPASLREARQTFEREYISTVLETYGWRMTEAARVLGIERANLYRKTRQLGITRLKPSRAS